MILSESPCRPEGEDLSKGCSFLMIKEIFSFNIFIGCARIIKCWQLFSSFDDLTLLII